MRSVVRSQLGLLARAEDVEDALADIVVKAIQNDWIGQYDPSHISEYNGKPVTFKAFILKKTALYCRGKREALQRQGREVLLVDSPVGEESTPWLELFGPGSVDDYPSDSEAYTRLRSYLEGRDVQPGQLPLLPLFDTLVQRVTDRQSTGPQFVCREFGLTRRAGAEYMAQLRTALREAVTGAAPAMFEVGGVALTAAQVRQAADALRASRGNRVLPVFQAIGHPLADAGKTWYLPFAKEEQAAYPEIRQAKGGHYIGGHGSPIKAALIHRLERMLEEKDALTATVAERLNGPWIELEAVLARVPGATPELVAMVMDTARLAFGGDLHLEQVPG
jgi:hypothetical protein